MANFRQMDNSAKRLLLIPESMEKSFRVFALPGLHSDLPCFVACGVEEQVSTLYLLSKSFCKDESWFISNSVKSDGGLGFLTAVDPVLILLNFLHWKSKDTTNSTFVDESDLFYNEDFPNAQLLSSLSNFADLLAKVCDVKELNGGSYYRFSKEKSLRYTVAKVNRLLEQFKDLPLMRKLCPDDPHWHSPDAPLAKEDKLNRVRAVVKVLRQVLGSWMIDLLIAHYKVGDLSVKKTLRELATVIEPAAYHNIAQENRSAQAKRQKVSGNPKSKPAQGMRSISSFFAQKS